MGSGGGGRGALRSTLVLAAIVAPAAPAAAAQQHFTGIAGVGGVAFVEHRVNAGFGVVERTAGPVLSAGVALNVRRVTAVVQARAGTLPRQSAGANDRDFGELGGAARLRVSPWLAAEAGLTARSYSSNVGRQRWVLVRTGAEARMPLAWGDAAGVFRLAYLPVVSVPGLPQPRLAFAAGAGMEYAAGPVRLRALFELERYDFRSTAIGERLEQLSSVSVAATFAFGGRR